LSIKNSLSNTPGGGLLNHESRDHGPGWTRDNAALARWPQTRIIRFRVSGAPEKHQVSGLGLNQNISGFGFRIFPFRRPEAPGGCVEVASNLDYGFGLRVSGFRFLVSDFGFRISGFGCRFDPFRRPDEPVSCVEVASDSPHTVDVTSRRIAWCCRFKNDFSAEM